MALQVKEDLKQEWVPLLFYGHPRLVLLRGVWDNVPWFLNRLDKSFVIWGDFNQVLHPYKRKRSARSQVLGTDWLLEFVDRHRLIDGPYSGVKFTWTNNKSWLAYERLDRAMGTLDWMQMFRKVSLLALLIQRSDHNPIILDANPCEFRKWKGSRFEATWLMDSTMELIVKKVRAYPVAGSTISRLFQHQNMVLRHLKHWHNLPNRSLAAQINGLRRQLAKVQKEQNLGTQGCKDLELRRKADCLLEKQDLYWAQRLDRNA